MPVPGLLTHRVHRRAPRTALDRWRSHRCRQPRGALRSTSSLRPRDGMEDLRQRQRGTDLQEPGGKALDLDAFADPYCSERRTASLIASCSATFCARPGTMTRTSDGVGVGGAARARSSCDKAVTSCTV